MDECHNRHGPCPATASGDLSPVFTWAKPTRARGPSENRGPRSFGLSGSAPGLAQVIG